MKKRGQRVDGPNQFALRLRRLCAAEQEDGKYGGRVLVESSYVVGPECWTPVYAHVLSEVIVAAEVFPASLDRTLVRCNTNTT
jgi:hypothetical protein